MFLLSALMFYYAQIGLGNTSTSTIKDYASVEAISAGADVSIVHAILKGESGYNVNISDGDMVKLCPVGVNKGKPIQARGLGQITKCYHPEVSDKQAHDPIFSVQWVVNQVKQGNCQKEFSTCPIKDI